MLVVRNISITFDGQTVLDNVSLEARQGEILCMLGPSGCGKTTLLRIIAGLERPDSGDIWCDGQSITTTPVHTRGFGLMFQDFALFPHMTVAQNVAFGLRMRGRPDVQGRIQEVLKLVGLSGFENRDVARLSGGERQRVALARSLAPEPRLLMLDEPLGSLDATLRSKLVLELRWIIKEAGLTAIYVTHDQEEAFAIADRVAIMNAGTIEQVDVPEVIYHRPVTVFAARFLGLNNIVPVLNADGRLLKTPVGIYESDSHAPYLLLHPAGVKLAEMRTDSVRTSISGIVSERIFQGDSYRLVVTHDSQTSITLTVPSYAAHVPETGNRIELIIDPGAVVPLAGSHSAH